MGEWQPIDTAPRGRKIIVGYRNELGLWRTILACYYEVGTLECGEEQDEDGFAPEGWYEESETSDTIFRCSVPISWQPLPEPPTTSPYGT